MKRDGMAIFKNYYQILGVDVFADPETVKAAFRKLARQHHPDLNAGNAHAEEKFKEINEAYEILSNPEKRAMHDATIKAMQGLGTGKAAARKQAAPPPKGKGGPTPGAEKKAEPKPTADPNAKAAADGKVPGKSQEKPANTPINELFESFLKKGFSDGGARKKDPDEGVFRKNKEPGSDKSAEKPQRGEDVIVKTAISPVEASEGVVKTVNVQHNEICRRCSGTGKVNGTVCNACTGEKILVRLKKIDVRIPAGVKNGSRVRVAKEGGRGAGGAENGDLFLQIEILFDPSLRVEGLDVYGDVALSVTDAVLGGEVEVPTLNGPVKMTVPPGTQTGKVFRLKERGIQSGLSKGDHFVTVVVVTPEGLTTREKELYQELARLRPEKPTLKKPR
ncbi:MAG: chaperone DnaJ domain protein [Vampirovibrio sp.]|nr:chaperone DnaJ domain protein [Vampirovibrio sp.]